MNIICFSIKRRYLLRTVSVGKSPKGTERDVEAYALSMVEVPSEVLVTKVRMVYHACVFDQEMAEIVIIIVIIVPTIGIFSEMRVDLDIFQDESVTYALSSMVRIQVIHYPAEEDLQKLGDVLRVGSIVEAVEVDSIPHMKL